MSELKWEDDVIDFTPLVNLAVFMIRQIADRPENTKDGEVNWHYVVGDVYLMYGGEYNEQMLVDAIMLIQHAGGMLNDESLLVPEGVTIH